jgi:hypothetical protein
MTRVPGAWRALLVVVASCAVIGQIAWAAAAGELPHDQVRPMTGSVTADQATFLPTLRIVNGCQPYPAVQDDGSYSGGLEDTGSESGGCRDSSKGQTVVRSQCEDDGLCAHLYALYFPKDQGMIGDAPTPEVGHRHEWENVVVWVQDGAVEAVSFSQHGGYSVKKPGEIELTGTSVTVEYSTGGATTHSFSPGSGSGIRMPAPVSLESVPTAARDTLNTPDTFGGSDFPARDDLFEAKLAAARPSWL